MLFDSHAHYDDEKFHEDRDKVIENAFLGGVSYILNAATDIATSKSSIALSKRHEHVYAAVGIHPHNLKEADESLLDTIITLSKNPKVVALGEIGLDYHYDFSPKDMQKHWFSLQINLAKMLKLPIIVHDREAHEDILSLVKSENARDVGGVFHCFSGSVEMAREVLNQNFMISIGGPITFKNAKKVLDVVKFVPDDRLLIETDCPYLAPEPNRGKRNHSGWVHFVAEKIAETKGQSFEVVSETTLMNAKRLFRIT